jgi:dihydroflavonol-4-reductase
MNVCVTGATGFIGAHVAARLVRAGGGKVRVTVRDPARLEALAGTDVEPVQADMLDRSSMRKALEGCEILFHAAAMVGSRPARDIWRANAIAPRIVVETAAEAGVRRVVLTSTAATLGPAPPGRAAAENQAYPARGIGMVYPDSKREGEIAAFATGDRLGVEAVAVNPGYVLGPPLNRSLRGETSTRIVMNYLLGRLPAVVDSYTNVVDVEDVAQGHLLAARAGGTGERYVLGGQNMRWSELIEQVAKISGRHHPVLVLPPEIASGARLLSGVRLPGVPLEGIRLMAPDWRYSSAKARRELGYVPRPAEETLRRTVDWCLELIESGGAGRSRSKSFDLMASGVRLGDRLQLLAPLRLAGRLAGRRMVL